MGLRGLAYTQAGEPAHAAGDAIGRLARQLAMAVLGLHTGHDHGENDRCGQRNDGRSEYDESHLDLRLRVGLIPGALIKRREKD